jgi:hypothetical protein
MRCAQSRSSQTEFPDTQPRVGDTLQRRANAPLLPTKPQQPIETGLFGDQHKQGEMFR